MRLVLSAFMTVDGVMEAPGFDEHRDGRNAWALRLHDPESQEWNAEQIRNADAVLLGRVTYQIWAAFWKAADPANEMTQRLHALPKYVVSRTLQRADWVNTTILSGDAIAEIEALKARPGGDLVLYGSADLAATLVARGLIDEYRLMVFPVLLGSGKRLFADRQPLQHLRLVSSQTFPKGICLLTYVPEDQAPTSQYVAEYAWTDEQTRALQEARTLDRILATVLFTDIVDSTARAAAMGDRTWRQLVDRTTRSPGPRPSAGSSSISRAPATGSWRRSRRRRARSVVRSACRPGWRASASRSGPGFTRARSSGAKPGSAGSASMSRHACCRRPSRGRSS